ncbi:MAG TPA: RNA-binding cell elongation regulator Jag/EloR [Desulfatiglandales bacterium]|nr:RNA-binding cell elongation regulator Jag/EloR [Desulfatiglandales bacterium]
MSSIEIEARTTEEAIKKACEHLHLSQEDLDIEVLESRSAGIFGLIGNKKARIRVKIKTDNSMLVAEETLERIISLMSLDSKVSGEKKGDDIVLNIEGSNTAILIGYKGRTLEALEYIVNKVVNKAAEKKVRVILDSENYRQRREESLQRLALKMGDQAKRTGKTVTMNAINPHDRRIIHLTLKGDPQVQTKSDGEGLLKRVCIIPNRKKTNEKQSD